MQYNKREDTIALCWAKKIKAASVLGGRCENCKNDDLFVLEFHHPDDNKAYDFGKARCLRWSIIKSEIKKCRLLCANCHFEAHHVADSRGTKLKNKFMQLKGQDSCRCGYRGPSLDFHHVGEKRFNIGDVVGRKKKVSIEELLLELDSCDIRCRNCHAIEHVDVVRFERLKGLIEYKVKNHRELREKLDKNEVLLLAKSMSQTSIARKLGCAKSTICGILKNSVGVAELADARVSDAREGQPRKGATPFLDTNMRP